MSKFNPLSKRHPSQSAPSPPALSSSPSLAPTADSSISNTNTTPTPKISSPPKPRPSKSTFKSNKGTPSKSNTTPFPPPSQIQATSSTSTDSSKGSGGGGMIASASGFFRKRARSISSSAKKEEKEKEGTSSTPNIAPQPPVTNTTTTGASLNPNTNTPPSILLNESSSTNTIVPSMPIPFKARGITHSRSQSQAQTLSQTPPDRELTSRSRTVSNSNSDSHTLTPLARSRSRGGGGDSGSGSHSHSRSRSRPRRDQSPGPLDLNVKSLDTAASQQRAQHGDQDQDVDHHSAFGLPTNWWDRTQAIPRRWNHGDDVGGSALLAKDSTAVGKDVRGKEVKRKETAGSSVNPSVEQAEGWDSTRQRVAIAARSVLGTTLDLTHEALVMSVDFLDLAPIPGLRVAAETLLHVWDCLQKVDMNRMACLRLTQRCADILICVRQEVHDAGDDVGEELKGPVDKLAQSFNMVYKFLLKQTERPFLKRYLKREEILRQIAGCDSSLSDSVNAFSLSIQIRILKQVQALNSRILSNVTVVPQLPPPTYVPIPEEPIDPSTPTPAVPYVPSNPTEIRARLHAFRQKENERDAGLDLVDLRQLMRTALQTTNDVQMIEVLQVGREEMPEAIKTLQRALEREVEKENAGIIGGSGFKGTGAAVMTMTPGPDITASLINNKTNVEEAAEVRRASEPATGTKQDAGLERRKTIASSESKESETTGSLTYSGSGGSGCDGRARDTLDREFIESGIDALRRVSHPPDYALPSWTITKYEVDLDEKIVKIGFGYFSTVYKGTWRKRTVAIKVLATKTPHEVFMREISIWKGLNHPNVLELYGASSASGEPPWFFVSPYCRNGSLVTWLRGMKNGDDVDLLRCMHQIAKGMEYLHRMDVLHGDLKCANVLVDDNKRCLVSDFGQSEMRSEAYRLSGTAPQHGTLRWQAPEIMGGSNNRLTREMDVYAFAICCCEILDKGAMPWQHQDDNAVVRFVLEENKRPPLPQTRASSPALTNILNACWERDSSLRPSFKRIAADLKHMRIKAGSNVEEIESPRPRQSFFGESMPTRPSPDMRPIPLPGASTVTDSDMLPENSPSPDGSFQTATSEFSSDKSSSQLRLKTSDLEQVRMPEPVLYTPSLNNSQASSIFDDSGDSNPSSAAEEFPVAYDGYESPPPANDRIADIRNERRYRLLLTHDFHPSLTLPLWTPSSISLGAVGYLEKPSGAFITLFNSLTPAKSSDPSIANLPSLYGYGRITRGEQRQDKRGAARRGLDALAGLLTFKSYSQSVSRRYSYQLRDGHKAAFMCSETTKYRYVEDLDTPKKWFKANVDSIMHIYGAQHRIQKEDLFLVIGTLDVPDYALFVSHKHPDGQVHFNVFGSPKPGQFWGTFTTDTDLPPQLGGPSYHEEVPGNLLANCLSANKVSMAGAANTWNTVLLARLRFKPDVMEPTSL